MPRVLLLQRRRGRRDQWVAALARAGFVVDACESVKDARMKLWQLDYDAIVAQTPPEGELADLMDAVPGPWAPPLLLIGAPYGEPVAVPRAFAVSLCTGDPGPDRLPDLLRTLLDTAAIAHPAVPHGRADMAMVMPPARVAKWKSWLVSAY